MDEENIAKRGLGIEGSKGGVGCVVRFADRKSQGSMLNLYHDSHALGLHADNSGVIERVLDRSVREFQKAQSRHNSMSQSHT